MKKKPFILALSLLLMVLVTGCSTKEEHISIQKLENKTYHFEAYKQEIETRDAEKAKGILKNADWREYVLEKDHPKADFIFYFNDDKNEGNIAVYYVWVNPDDHVTELTRDQHKKHVKLNRDDSKTILDLLNE
ncbi:hypothetical protein AS888_23490 [Peribacillus simplex]|uniref:Lipoprotein n=1 Tax=Peribacillus simplex TaxID=1478 RepID=A0A109MWD5_9BACI|nr:hypothetical protein [Peribacillus simplex]KWW16950.1 hypothetical protein AS888_23490 [Peribacillus simplex]